MYYVYVLLSLRDRGLYIGFSNDIKSRVIRHNNGEVISTKDRRPLILIYFECFANKKDAIARGNI